MAGPCVADVLDVRENIEVVLAVVDFGGVRQVIDLVWSLTAVVGELKDGESPDGSCWATLTTSLLTCPQLLQWVSEVFCVSFELFATTLAMFLVALASRSFLLK